MIQNKIWDDTSMMRAATRWTCRSQAAPILSALGCRRIGRSLGGCSATPARPVGKRGGTLAGGPRAWAEQLAWPGPGRCLWYWPPRGIVAFAEGAARGTNDRGRSGSKLSRRGSRAVAGPRLRGPYTNARAGPANDAWAVTGRGPSVLIAQTLYRVGSLIRIGIRASRSAPECPELTSRVGRRQRHCV